MPGAKRALCVGINQFKNYPELALNGCVTDTVSIKEMLTRYAGFAEDDVQVLTDAQATKAKVMSALGKLVDAASSGKVEHLVFSLSTHGTQVPDLADEEGDRAEEAFCMHDLAEKNDDWDHDRLITSDELQQLFLKLPAKVLLECFFDTSHNGGALRAIDLIPSRRPRWVPPPTPIAIDNMSGRIARSLGQQLLDAGAEHIVVWAASKTAQTSADARIGKNWHGAFTYYLSNRVKTASGQIKRSELIKLLRDDLKAKRYTQVPELNAARAAKGRNLGG